MVQIRIEETFTAPGNRLDTRLIPLAEELARYDNPHTVLDYLRQKAGGKLIRKMVTGELDCSHEALDVLPQTNSVTHLRNLLVLTEVLPARDEQLAQLQLDIRRLTNVSDSDDRLALVRYARWQLLPMAHRQIDQRGSLTTGTRTYLTNHLRVARQLCLHLRGHRSSLGTCLQPLVDRWVAAHRVRQGEVRRFLTWAAAHQLAPKHLAVSALANCEDRSIMSDRARVVLAHRLETDESITLPVRVSGCLVLQYGQHCTRLVALKADDVLDHPSDPAVCGLKVGRDPLWLRPRLSALVRRLVDDRRPIAATQLPNPYLLPGRRPGQPISASTLARRLAAHGIPAARLARNGAILAMVDNIHWKLVADLLGLADQTAYQWHHINGGDRASYVASRLKKHSAPASPE
ncbi:hypothetical protein [Streptomyces sp. PTD5-9]|uniref:hypothetical protein n=1 Tax=Streptomyces sp. PTD5-9 TaxID=3120150 RepID=UPI0030095761